jgi:propanol-preferring alcohol dehydrogenase
VRAAVLGAPGELVVRNAPEPRPGPDEVVVAVETCGVCRTDLQLVSGDLELRRRPVVPGHQVVGRRLDTGERVGLAWLGGADGTCRFCRAGDENLCPNARFTGWTADGGYAERVVARRDFLVAIP